MVCFFIPYRNDYSAKTRRIHMPTLGPLELVLIVVALILVFGVGKLGDVGKSLGRGIREFRQEVGNPNSNPNGVKKVDLIEESEQPKNS
jgi:sec-independent protein translocase protein TatA